MVSRETSDLLMPAKADCVTCHSPKGKVVSECITCHGYHARPQVAGHRVGGWIEPLPREAVYHDSLIDELAR